MPYPDPNSELGAVISPIAISSTTPSTSRTSTDMLGMWGDPTDTADRRAYADAERARNYERPPHY